MIKNIQISFFDFSKEWQCLFQDPANSIMENIIDLHHDIVFFQIIIISLVLWMIIRIFYFYREKNIKSKRALDLTHNIFIEIIWTITPTIILFFIAVPSYVLIYNLDEMNEPQITLKIIGHQWYWSYEYSDYSKEAFNDWIYPTFELEEKLLQNNTNLFEKSEKTLIFNVNNILTKEQYLYWGNLFNIRPRDWTLYAIWGLVPFPDQAFFNFFDGNYYYISNYNDFIIDCLEEYEILIRDPEIWWMYEEVYFILRQVDGFWFWLKNAESRFYMENLPEDNFFMYFCIENFFPKKEIIFDSYMLQEEDLEIGQLRLLEVDNNIYLPIETTIRLLITASDVIHSWTIPSLGIKMDAIPGRLNQVSIYINREAIFYGQCSELCGINHSFMPIGLKSILIEEYINWLKSLKQNKA